jgi:hypothetical protein
VTEPPATPPPVSPTPTPATPVAAPPTAVAAPPAPTATTLSVHFVSEPPGATVKENGVDLCTGTPCDHAFSADLTLEHKIVIAHAGYRPEPRVVHAGDSMVQVTLVAAKAWVPPPHVGTNPKPSDSGGAAPTGFKDIPY